MTEQPSLHAPTRSELHTSDRVAVQEFLSRSYRTRIRVQRMPGTNKLHYSHARTAVGLFATETINQRGNISTAAEKLESAVVYLPQRGHIECSVGGVVSVAGPGGVLLAQSPDSEVLTSTTDVALRSVVLDQTLLLDVAPSPGLTVRFTGHHPVDSAAAEIFRQVAEFVQSSVLIDNGKATPLVIGAAGRLLASAAMAAFANTAIDNEQNHAGNAPPSALRRAIEFVEENAHRDIGITEIAASVYLTPRSVQYLFRRQLNTTPTEYLRSIRMARARDDLERSDRSTTTVATTAAHWGFAHTGRFAVLYRQMFGESPHETLRRD